MKFILIPLFLLPLLICVAAGQRIESSPSCTDGLEPPNDNLIIHPKDNGFDAFKIMNEGQDCARLYAVGSDYAGSPYKEDMRKGYDTLKLFIESCATLSYVLDCGPPRRAFSDLDRCVSDMDTANIRWLEYREWLKKVLYLSNDSLYYCADVNSMFGTFNYLSDGDDRPHYNEMIAIMDYLIETNRCPDATVSLWENRGRFREYQYLVWADSVHDSTATPMDTSAYSIDSIGFSILRGPEFGAVHPRTTHTDNFSELTASKNPFTDETILRTTLADAAMLKLEIYDVLGKQLYSENQFFSSGEVKWKLSGKLLPQGSLYARVSTIDGRVRTIKLIKE